VRYALWIAILFMVPLALSGWALSNGSLDTHAGASGSSLFHQTILGDTAIVRGRTQATGVVGERRGSARLRFTDTFIKRSGQWQAVASHATTLRDNA
jgi:Domain of unknown function (DUF4440)